jgi:hypothetical protein
MEQRFAMLRHVEALRMYAAEHGGALPTTLSAVSTPLPDDPMTGKQFAYVVVGETAHLRGAPPAGQESVAAFNLHYEITVQKAGSNTP